MGEDIRRRVVASFRNAIDCEQNNNDIEAYRKYLDGVALVAAALLQDADSTWVAGESHLSEKERKSLLGFAKQSVDRLIFLLDKQDESRDIFFGPTSSMLLEKPNADLGNVSSPVTQNVLRKSPQPPVAHSILPIPPVEEQEVNEVSPIEHMRKENQLLMTRYATRLRSATTKVQRHNLQLELERRLMENSTIAQQQQEAWEKSKSKLTAWCLQMAEEKFKIKEKIQCGSITEADFKKQRLFAAALQYEEEHSWLNKLKQELLLFPEDEEKQRDIVAHILNEKLHPLGNLMGQMQHVILNKINPLIWSNINERNGGRGGVEDLNYIRLQPRAQEAMNQDVLAQEERKAFQRHFNNIADDMKQDVKLLETLMGSLYEPLATDAGGNILLELLHELYFPPLKPALISLIRLGVSDVEEDLKERMAAQRANPEPCDMDEEILRSSCHALHRVTGLGSPCQMLDSLTALMKCLAVPEDAQTKSIGADDLLPRLMSVVLSTGMPTLLAEAIYMENFMPVSRALGEAGYCLTVLQSVMTCVQIPTG